ncbi:hypothetical protein BVRB_5g116240 [Beta vulgaris subsp. vulgaris]|nr:hypothetical protein BVRB_5g116240 [Beta vulgaris subsp. vulgaris]
MRVVQERETMNLIDVRFAATKERECVRHKLWLRI